MCQHVSTFGDTTHNAIWGSDAQCACASPSTPLSGGGGGGPWELVVRPQRPVLVVPGVGGCDPGPAPASSSKRAAGMKLLYWPSWSAGGSGWLAGCGWGNPRAVREGLVGRGRPPSHPPRMGVGFAPPHTIGNPYSPDKPPRHFFFIDPGYLGKGKTSLPTCQQSLRRQNWWTVACK